jgi:glutamate formiminotransferase / 5-formyltetrahydrofolate cyclo-ligase
MEQFSLVAMSRPILLAVPNVSEGRDPAVIEVIGAAFAGGPPDGSPPSPEGDEDRSGEHGSREHARAGAGRDVVHLLDVHSDRDHHRSVYTLAGRQQALANALLTGARTVVERVDVMHRDAACAPPAQHPHVGSLDVVPIVYLETRARGAACAEALVVAERLGSELGIPVFLYGELTGSNDPAHGDLAESSRSPAPRTRAELRRGGVSGLARRMSGEGGGDQVRLEPDFGPPRMHPSAGATLVGARPPLVAFNLQLAPSATLADAQRVAALLRDGGAEGLAGVRAIAVALGDGAAQVSMNIERPFELPLATVVEAVRAHAPVRDAELVGLAPRAALEGFPEDLPLLGFDPSRHLIENALPAFA